MAYLLKKNIFFLTDGQTEGRTNGRSYFIMPQILFGGIKKRSLSGALHTCVYFPMRHQMGHVFGGKAARVTEVRFVVKVNCPVLLHHTLCGEPLQADVTLKLTP